ncbi:hypothetical protein EUAN_23690 [Andreesenia angusta]|uniref:Uncharacterized protein n=1 Tax=Andreesenia angusta TaxID=39480 RepID=A0A1S1V448_9FIRM|nr:hypothetical protein [Andreesenia angusta]OHW61288.1 hypothetical protein EUAN_23690 [Andreesenia angusta]
MDLRELIRICSAVVVFCSFGIILAGTITMKKAASELRVGEAVLKETEAKFEKGYQLIKLGSIPAAIFGIAVILLS